ncbi:MAG: methylmalonyl-CoA mutase [Chloroflexi bacterium]|nr:methylmalonyl-CoA mutase [Chloroflexota bacterium]
MDNSDGLAEKKREWAKRRKVDSLPASRTDWGTPVDVVYTSADIGDNGYMEALGLPGEYPYTRGIYPGMYRANPWQIRMYTGLGSAEDTNRRCRYLVAQGNMGVHLAFDLPTQVGFDSDSPQAKGEVGQVGVAVDTLKEFEIIFKGLPLDKIASTLNANGMGPVMLAMYVALAEKQGVPVSQLRGVVVNDVLSEYVGRGTWIFPPKPTLRLAGDAIEYCIKYMPSFNPITVRGAPLRESGADSAQELGYAFANAFAYMQNVMDRGIDVDKVAPMINFFFAPSIQFFEEAARFRAARRLWARTMKEKYGARDPASMLFRFSGGVDGVFYRTQEPKNNLIRGAYGLLGMILGGVQGAIHPAFDEPFSTPTKESALLALRTQQILAYETGVMKTVDPLGGSYYIEALTNRMEQDILRILKEVEAIGGIVPAIERGYIQKMCAQNAFRISQEEASGERIVVGVNRFQGKPQRRRFRIHRLNPKSVERQLARLKKTRAERDGAAVNKALEQLREVANSNENVIPALVQAVKAYATVGEIASTLRKVYGEFRQPSDTF